ncbi:YesK family protein [Virgibacillus oceani]
MFGFFANIFSGLFFGLIIFVFTLIASKIKGKLYLAPIVTFLVSIGITAYGFITVGGFEGMAYGIVGAGILGAAILGTILLPFINSKMKEKHFNKWDKGILITSPLILFVTIGLVLYTDDDYWVIDEGLLPNDNQESYYSVSTISEGRKQIEINLGEKYIGKEIEVENVKATGNTEVMVEIVDGGESDQTPYIRIGVDQIVEPLIVESTEGEVIHSELEMISK